MVGYQKCRVAHFRMASWDIGLITPTIPVVGFTQHQTKQRVLRTNKSLLQMM